MSDLEKYLEQNDSPEVLKARDWEGDVRYWLGRQGDLSDELANDICRFFVRAFDHTRHPQSAWFGVHKDRISLVVGGIFLAAVLRTSRDRGFWVLLADEPPPIEGLKHHAVKSARRLNPPLFWGHSPSLSVIPRLLSNDAIWKSFSQASERILQAGIGKERDSVQLKRGKVRLSDLWRQEEPPNPETSGFTGVVRASLAIGAGFGDSEQNRRVEQAAVQLVRAWYEQRGWCVESVEARRCGFDLLCTRNDTEEHVEVKGVAGSERRFIITSGELRQARENDRFVLALVTSAVSNPVLDRWTAASFRDEFVFEPIQYWAARRDKPEAEGPNKGFAADAKRLRG